MKKIVLGLLTLIAVLTAIVLVRANGLESRQNTGVAHVAVNIDEDAALHRYATSLTFPTISVQEPQPIDTAAFLAFRGYLAETYPLVHDQLALESVADLSLLYTWEGTDTSLPAAVLMGHFDVVPVIPGTEADWLHPPFAGEIADGFVWGRGSMDDKVSVIAILEAVEMLLAEGYQPPRTFYLAFGHDEELGGYNGAASIANLLADRTTQPLAFVLDEGGFIGDGMIPGVEGTGAIIGIGEKGYLSLELVVEGEGGHSSMPPNSTNIGILSEAIRKLETDQFPARLDYPARHLFDFIAPESTLGMRAAMANLWLTRPIVERMSLGNPQSAAMLRTTTAVTVIEAGVKDNVLPINARAIVNHRIIPGETVESVIARDISVIDDDRVQVLNSFSSGRGPSTMSDPYSEGFRLIERSLREILPDEDLLVAPYLVMGGTDASYYSELSTNVFRFIAARIGEGDTERIHGTNERMAIESFTNSIRFFYRLIQNAEGL